MICPKCRSDCVKLVSSTYPQSYECENCGNTFTKSSQALIDE